MARRSATQDNNLRGANHPLSRYWTKRNFKATSEPMGNERAPAPKPADPALPFVVQKHAATRLHYDFRLGWKGVLKSWAVTKGPSYSPGDKRLAVMVEDHPWEYRDFEGTIPKGQYGGGTVMVWDEGTWLPHGDVDRGLRDGHLKFELQGKKLKGSWALIRMKERYERNGGPAQHPDRSNWLLIKEKDEYAQESGDRPITVEAPDSAVTGRSLEEIATNNDRVWNSHERSDTHRQEASSGEQTAESTRKQKRSQLKAKFDLDRFSRERFPGFVAPQLAQQTATAPTGGEWLHELKFDGYRIQIHLQKNKKSDSKEAAVQLLSRNALDWTERMPDIAAAAKELNVESAIVDGEAVVLDERGVSNFADLQAVFHEGRQKYITYFAFDLLHLNGHNLRPSPLSERRKLLEQLLAPGKGAPLRFSEAIDDAGALVYEQACSLGAEGIVSKQASSPYTSGRSRTWLKTKCRLEQEFVIGGFTLPANGMYGVGALLLGYYDRDELRYAGRTGTGFTENTHRSLRKKLDRLGVMQPSIKDVPPAMQRGVRWVKPELVAQVAFSTWTRDNVVRQAAFKGLREDKPARQVIREPAALPDGAADTPDEKSRMKQSQPTKRGAAPEIGEKKGRADQMNVLAITHPEKVLDQESGLTKGGLAEYFFAVAEHLLPHIADRPLSVVRCPDGNSKPCFFQKHVGVGLPKGVKSVPIRSRKTGESEEFLTVDSVEGLVGLAQMGVLEIHPWGSRNESLETPDRIVFDLDPDATIEWHRLTATAQELKKRLGQLGFKSFVKSTGGKGLHVVVPILPTHEWPEVKDFAHRLVLEMERKQPESYVTKMTKASRKNRIYLDYLRNDRGATSIAAFSPRARPGAPVAMPLHWSELHSAQAPVFPVSDFQRWKKRLARDPWRELEEVRQELTGELLLRH